ncbi:MAG TPA: alpha/beta hydrolase [Haliangiales bacterium]|nr:alpha/beta hydrolase [Haliangiales bacterium]
MNTPFYREAGAGPGVVCLHANASTSSQWRPLLEALSPKFHVLAADSYGSGNSPPWPTGRDAWLRDEVALLEPVFARAGDPFVLVGHSYGGAIALIAALSQPHRVRALAVYEPTLFSLIEANSPPPNDADGIKGAVTAAMAYLDAGDTGRAAEQFIDYWMGKGSWARMPEARRAPIARSVVSIPAWAHALLHEPTPLSAFRELKVPVLYMTGGESPASSLGVARLLTPTLPNIEVIELKGLGHMAPVTQPEPVNQAIARFLARIA